MRTANYVVEIVTTDGGYVETMPRTTSKRAFDFAFQKKQEEGVVNTRVYKEVVEKAAKEEDIFDLNGA